MKTTSKAPAKSKKAAAKAPKKAKKIAKATTPASV
jgi:hypothetical protein